MSQSTTPPTDARQTVLNQLAELTTMEHGTLREEYRERPSPDGEGSVRLGPYFLHQCWENGRNLSRRVPLAEVESLRDDLKNGERFEKLVSHLGQLAIAQGRTQRAALCANKSEQSQDDEVKKNSPPKPLAKDIEKAKPSWRKSRSGSKKKA